MADLTLRALIADDEPLARGLVGEYLASHPDIRVIAEAGTGLEAARCIQEEAPDLVFLDIQMPKLTGLEVLQTTGLRKGVIFTTAYDRHALEAFDLHAVDYLLKPFSQERFDAALERARRLLKADLPGIERLIGAEPLRRVLVRDAAQWRVLPLEEVDYIQAQADQVAFHHQGRDHLKPQRISELEAQLDPRQFVRVHRSFVVNIGQIESVERTESDAYALRLRSGKRIPVSRSGYERLRGVL
ncbi:MAG TPA: LytTR family DNA-binding domain-containing protein [Albitalea sp.]|nr:LytTR family DNA-binding domain-containing protein [Albitalea sp.]